MDGHPITARPASLVLMGSPIDTRISETEPNKLAQKHSLAAFEKNVINTAISSLRVSLENVSAAQSVIRDTDFATETAELTRSQILVAAGTSVLAAANASPQNVLSLL